MGFFSSTPSHSGYTPRNEQEAWVAIMYSVISCDGSVSEVEIDKLLNLIKGKTFFAGHNISDYYKNAQTAKVSNDVSCQELVDGSASFISEDNKPTLTALLVELVLADSVVEYEEEEIMAYISKKMNVDVNLLQKMVDVMMIRNKYNNKVTA